MLTFSTGLPALLKSDITGRSIRSIELEGVIGSTGKQSTVYDLKLGDVFVTDIKDSSGKDELAFTFEEFSLTTKPQSAGGSSTTVSWDLLNTQLARRQLFRSPVLTPDNPPVAVDDSASATTGVGGVASGNVLANDSDPDGDALTATAFDGDLAHGHLTLVANGDFTYTVTDLNGPTGSHLDDLFNYTVSDGRETASANLEEITLNRAPNAVADAAVATTGIGGTAAGNVLDNDSDPDSDATDGDTGRHRRQPRHASTPNADGSFEAMS